MPKVRDPETGRYVDQGYKARRGRDLANGPFVWKLIGVNAETGEVCLAQFGRGAHGNPDECNRARARLIQVIFADSDLTPKQRAGFASQRAQEWYAKRVRLIPWDDPAWEMFLERPEFAVGGK